jgi:hypothetical protein
LYYSIPKTLDALPEGKAQDLRDRFRRFNVQALMLAPQAERDTAAEQLTRILREARQRKTDDDGKPSDPRRSAP